MGPLILIQCVQNLFRMSEYFEKYKFEFFRFYCNTVLVNFYIVTLVRNAQEVKPVQNCSGFIFEPRHEI